jgi:hypothetical protein
MKRRAFLRLLLPHNISLAALKAGDIGISLSSTEPNDSCSIGRCNSVRDNGPNGTIAEEAVGQLLCYHLHDIPILFCYCLQRERWQMKGRLHYLGFVEWKRRLSMHSSRKVVKKVINKLRRK